MPKSYSDQEKAYIKKRLKEEAYDCMSRYGIRRTTVDELVKRVKIPKGTFYLFYPSKEMLLFEVILEQHEQVEQELLASLQGLKQADITVDQVTDVVTAIFKKALQMPILKLLNSDEVEILARKLPPEIVAEHLGHDSNMLEQVFQYLPTKPDVKPESFSAAFQAIYFSTLHAEVIEEQNFEEGLRLLVRGLILQMM